MTVFEAIIYGLIQGLSEFLPISSSGHLVLLPRLLDIDDPGVAFDLAMHLGTLVSVSVYFRRQVFSLFWECPRDIYLKKISLKDSILGPYIITCVGTVILVLIFLPFSESYGRSENLVAFNLIFFGGILALSDYFSRRETKLTALHPLAFLAIGLAQALAIFPGVSRSGVTISVGRIFQLSRQEASEFSFLLSIPLIFAGAILKLPELADAPYSLLPLVVGVLTSGVVGLLSIHCFLKLIARVGIWWFFFYRLLIASLILGTL